MSDEQEKLRKLHQLLVRVGILVCLSISLIAILALLGVFK